MLCDKQKGVIFDSTEDERIKILFEDILDHKDRIYEEYD